MKKREYEQQLFELQVELGARQQAAIDGDERTLLILEGRDAAGKDGAIRRLVRYLRPRKVRVFAPGKPTERERTEWYFQRFLLHLPAGGELVVFNRSWYNRAGVERVMGFCTEAECESFLRDAPAVEKLLVRGGTRLAKVYLDVSREEQARRFAERAEDPRRNWQLGPIDARAQELFDDYTRARDEMLARTDHAEAPWTVVPADDKRSARLAVIRAVLGAG